MSEPNALARVPLFAMAVIVAGLTLVIVLSFSIAMIRGWGDYRFGLFAIPVVVAVVYLNEYRKLPYEPRRAPAPPTSPAGDGGVDVESTATGAEEPSQPNAAAGGPEEPFEDPVEEADRLSTETPSNGEPPPGPEAPAK